MNKGVKEISRMLLISRSNVRYVLRVLEAHGVKKLSLRDQKKLCAEIKKDLSINSQSSNKHNDN